MTGGSGDPGLCADNRRCRERAGPAGQTRNLRFNMITVLFPDGLNDSCAQGNVFCTILEEIKSVMIVRG